MQRASWARSDQFNWTYDAMGGCQLQEAVQGLWSGCQTTVADNGKVYIQDPMPGGGQVFHLRGVWKTSAVFAWNGYWADPESGDTTNYYQGGSFANQGNQTIITLGTSLPAGTQVQLYYIYKTGTTSAQLEGLNNHPCIRKARRSYNDFTFDFAVDRVLDLMAVLHFASQERNQDYQALIDFLWDNLKPREESLTPPLVFDRFERTLWDRGSFLLYRNSDGGPDWFDTFTIEPLVAGATSSRALKVILPAYENPWASWWWGYGFNWDLSLPPFSNLSQVSFRLKTGSTTSKVHNIAKFGSGSATLVVQGQFSSLELIRFVLYIETGGEVGAATFKYSYDGGVTWAETGCLTADANSPADIGYGLKAYWIPGDGQDFYADDYWTFFAFDPEWHPRRLKVVVNDSYPGESNEWGLEHQFFAGLPDKFSGLTDIVIPFDQFKSIDDLVYDGDRRVCTTGAWFSASQQDTSWLDLFEEEEEETIDGDKYYTRKLCRFDLGPYSTAFGVWFGVNTGEVDSTDKTNVNCLVKIADTGEASHTVRIKIKDNNNTYWYKDIAGVATGSWQRLTANFADMVKESGPGSSITHPVTLVDVGIPSNPPLDGTIRITDIRFGSARRFSNSTRLRVLEFKFQDTDQDLETKPLFWIDDFALDLNSTDSYAYVPRLALSLTPYGQNPWRGPTLTHYAHPLGPDLAEEESIKNTYLSFLSDAQNKFYELYAGVKGPFMPVHSRNDLENISLIGEEYFDAFSWWKRFRDYGTRAVCYLFNEALVDASGNGHTLTVISGTPTYTTGICQPGNTALRLNNTSQVGLDHNSDIDTGSGAFSIILICKGTANASSYVWLVQKQDASDGWVIQTKDAGNQDLQLKITTSAGTYYSDITGVLDGNWHMVAWIVDPDNSLIHRVKDGTYQGNNGFSIGTGLNNTAQLKFGPGTSTAFDLDYFCLEKRCWPGDEYEQAWDIAQGLENGSDYPEVGSGLAQAWTFMRLAEFYFKTGNSTAWTILENFLTWLDTHGTADGNGWKFPVMFSEYGFQYGDYDPGHTASLAIGCLYIYMKNGSSTANTWARRILDDLRENRQSPTYQYLYKSDYHYAWLNALVAHAFGLAITGRTGQSYNFADTTDDRDHFDHMLNQFFILKGDSKPNLLNSQNLPYAYIEDYDLWDYAPNYIMNREMGSIEAVVLMLQTALDYALRNNSWTWFDGLLRFLLLDRLVYLDEHNLESLVATNSLTELYNHVRVFYGPFDQDPDYYQEAKDQDLVETLGEKPLTIDLRYGQPVITEDSTTASLLASRLLARAKHPKQYAEATCFLEALRIETGDIVALTEAFHGLDETEFICYAKEARPAEKRVHLSLMRSIK